MRSRNETAIKNGFARLTEIKDRTIRRGMFEVLENAVQVALDAHNESHQKHIEIGDTYGWMLVHNGAVEDMAVVSTEKNEGTATEQLLAMASRVPKKGWVGVVMAGLQPASYFSIVYEAKMLEYAKQVTHFNFFQFFKKI